MELALLGLSLGLAAGVSPGPLLTLVVSSTLERGFGAGLRVAVAPLLTDTPIILLAVLVLRELSSQWLALLGAVGGLVVIGLGIDTLRPKAPPDLEKETASGSKLDLARGALVNLLNPHPWIFWITVQGPILIQGWRRDPGSAMAFLMTFYLAIVGSKIAVAGLIARGRAGLDRRWYRRILAACGVLLVAMGCWLILGAVSTVRAAG